MYKYLAKPIETIGNGPEALKSMSVGIFRTDENTSE